MYMKLYYDARIRTTVLARWPLERIAILEAKVTETIPEGEIEPHESFLFKDLRIPISFKSRIAQELFDAETEEIRAEVIAKQNEGPIVKTVYNTEGKERMLLVEEYQRYACAFAVALPSTST